MQIVIELDDKTWRKCVENDLLTIADLNKFIVAIGNGTPLPKGHGRLIDADRLRSMYSINRANFNTVVGIQKWVDDVPTIIPAEEVKE